jgi:hypothetical protein
MDSCKNSSEGTTEMINSYLFETGQFTENFALNHNWFKNSCFGLLSNCTKVIKIRQDKVRQICFSLYSELVLFAYFSKNYKFY